MTITIQQARQRFTIVPEPLRDAVFSLQTAEIMNGIAQQYHLDAAKMDVVSDIVGWVLLGFMHPEDVSREIQTQLNLPTQAAADISKSIDSKIFASLRDDLNKAYAPVPDEEKTIDPQIISPAPTPSAPKIISETFVATPKFGVTPAAANRDIAAPAPKPLQPPKPSNAAGWSKSTPQQPVVKLGATAPGIPTAPATPAAPKTISMPSAPTPANPTPAKPVARSMSEFERLDLMKKSSAPQSTAPQPTAPSQPTMPSAPKPSTASPATPPQPAPVMLHEVSSFAPIEQSSAAFNTRRPAQDQLRGTTAQGPMPTRPAVVEFGGGAPSTGSMSKSTLDGQPAPGASIPKPPAPMANTGPRQMTEIQAPRANPQPSMSVPMPAIPPKPPTPPAPGSPSSPQKGKVIVKDFLA
jgi:hypothetical protein